MEPQFCANENCVKSREHRGGRFRFRPSDGKTYCEECFRVEVQMNGARNLWDFETTHFTGERVHVRSRTHLDQLCKQHGVSNFARENMERSW